MEVAVNAGATETTIYIAGLLEKVTRGSLIEYRHLIHGGQGAAAIHTRRSGGTPASDTVYLHQDHLGSPELLTDDAGGQVVRLSFGAYGERRDGSDWDGAVSSADLTTIGNTSRHGFTGHEHLDAVGLIHMNGRVYDPLAARFLGADPIVGLGLSQDVNSYAYAWNNPLNVTDPSGLQDQDATHRQCRDSCFTGSFWDFLGAMGWLDFREPTIEEKRSGDFSSPSPSPSPSEDANWDGQSFGGPVVMYGVGNARVVTIYLRTFAPWRVFGGGFAGDNRTFSTDLEDTSRMTAEVVIDLQSMDVIDSYRWSDPSRCIENPCLAIFNGGRHVGPWAVPQATLVPNIDVTSIEGVIDIRLWGKVPLTPQAVTPDLNVNLRLWRNGGALECHMTGDRFPNAEAFVVFPDGSARILHTYETEATKSVGPLLNLPGSEPKDMGRCGGP